MSRGRGRDRNIPSSCESASYHLVIVRIRGLTIDHVHISIERYLVRGFDREILDDRVIERVLSASSFAHIRA